MRPQRGVGIDEPRQNGLALQVDTARRRSREFRRLRAAARRDDAAALHGHGIDNAELAVHRDDLSVFEQQVGLLRVRRRAEQKTGYECKKQHPFTS
jgi:hypothetical protein